MFADILVNEISQNSLDVYNNFFDLAKVRYWEYNAIYKIFRFLGFCDITVVSFQLFGSDLRTSFNSMS